MKQRIYIDTSVVGEYFDDEFSADTIAFFELNLRINILMQKLLEKRAEATANILLLRH